MRCSFHKIARLLFVISNMILGDENALTSSFLVSREDKNSHNVVLCRVLKLSVDFLIRIESENRLEWVGLVESAEKLLPLICKFLWNFMSRTIELCASLTRFPKRKFVAGLRHSWDYSWQQVSFPIHCSMSSLLLELAKQRELTETRKAAIEFQFHSSPSTKDFHNPVKREELILKYYLTTRAIQSEELTLHDP